MTTQTSPETTTLNPLALAFERPRAVPGQTRMEARDTIQRTAVQRIVDGLPFSNASGTFTGNRPKVGSISKGLDYLSPNERMKFREAYEGRQMAYVIRSYDMPIAWLDSEQWVIVSASSAPTQTTKRHLKHVMGIALEWAQLKGSE